MRTLGDGKDGGKVVRSLRLKKMIRTAVEDARLLALR